jgi:8-oxo-dGTP diphosphatase
MVALLDERRRILLVRQAYGRRVWALPGGALDAGESPADAAVREAREELGVDVELDGLVGVYRLPPPRPGLRFVFAARTAGVPYAADAAEIAEVAWFAADGLPSPAAASVAAASADAVAGTRGAFRAVTRRAEPRRPAAALGDGGP